MYWMTLLRDPMNRTISEFNYIMKGSQKKGVPIWQGADTDAYACITAQNLTCFACATDNRALTVQAEMLGLRVGDDVTAVFLFVCPSPHAQPSPA